jgi:hypothetical protein
MADNVVVTNQKTTFEANTNTDIPARTTEKSGNQVQHVIIDWGGAGAESLSVPTLPVSASSLPLPTGAATAANQLPNNHQVTVSNASIAVTAAALPLPTGAATAALQLPNNHQVTVSNASIAVTAAALPLPSGAATAALQLPNNHQVTVSNASIAVTAASLPLPTGAASEVELAKITSNTSSSELYQRPKALRYDEGATYTYIGEAVAGTAEAASSWRIKRLTNADNTIIWADGNINFDNIWANRASLSYS